MKHHLYTEIYYKISIVVHDRLRQGRTSECAIIEITSIACTNNYTAVLHPRHSVMASTTPLKPNIEVLHP